MQLLEEEADEKGKEWEQRVSLRSTGCEECCREIRNTIESVDLERISHSIAANYGEPLFDGQPLDGVIS